MSVLWALVALLSIQLGGLNGVSGQLLSSANSALLPSLEISPLSQPLQPPAAEFLRLARSVPGLPGPLAPGPEIPPQPKKKPYKDPAETNGQHCEASAWYFISKKKVDDYLNETVPEAIKKLISCAEFDLTGIVKTALEALDIDDLLKVTSSLGLGGDGSPLSGLTGSLPVPVADLPGGFLKSLPGGLPGVGGAGGLGMASNFLGNGNKLMSAFGGAKNVLGTGNPLEGKNPGDLLNSGVKRPKNSQQSQGLGKNEDIIKAASSGPNEISGVDLGTLQENPEKIGHLLEKLDLKLHASDIVIKNMTTVTEGSDIKVTASVSTNIKGSDDLLGSATDLIGFQVDITVLLIIGLNTNGTKCFRFEVLENQMKVEEIKIKIIDRIKRKLNQPVPIPLDSLVPTLLMLNVTSPEGECDLTLKNPACKIEATSSAKGDLFNYHLKSVNFTTKGLLIAYCSEINYKDKSIPVPGGPFPPIPEDGEASLAFSSRMVKALVTDIIKASSVKSNDGELKVKTMSYKLDSKKANLIIHAYVKENNIKSATIDLSAKMSHSCVIISGYISGNFNLLSSEYTVDPPDNDFAREMGKQLITKVVSNTNEDLRRFNVPLGPEMEVLNNAPVQVDPQGDLIASK